MYRKLGTRGVVFGVPAGPYAGKERVISFARLPNASKTRLFDALAGRGALSAILRTAEPRRSFSLVAIVVLVFGAWLLFGLDWPRPQAHWVAAVDVTITLLVGALVLRRRGAIRHGGSVIPTGAYLFPLDIVETNRDGTLHLIPLGGVREAAVAQEGSRPALLLTFEDGKTRTFPVNSPREAEQAYEALEESQHTLEKLTYGNDLSDAVNLDPFFEVRTDGTWKSVLPAPSHIGPLAMRLTTLGVAVLIGASMFMVRRAWGEKKVREWEEATKDSPEYHPEIFQRQLDALLVAASASASGAARTRPLAMPSGAEPQKAPREKFLPDDALAAADLAKRVDARTLALTRYEKVAAKPEMVALVKDLVEHAGRTGQSLVLYLTSKTVPCGPAQCVDVDETALRGMEDRVEGSFQTVFSEIVPRSVLPVDSVSEKPDAPALVVATELRNEKKGLTMTFDVELRVPGHKTPTTFRLTMPPPDEDAAATRLRDRSIFFLGARPFADDLLLARGLDRLYDELYGLFFSGPPRVPLSDRESDQEVWRTFGTGGGSAPE